MAPNICSQFFSSACPTNSVSVALRSTCDSSSKRRRRSHTRSAGERPSGRKRRSMFWQCICLPPLSPGFCPFLHSRPFPRGVGEEDETADVAGFFLFLFLFPPSPALPPRGEGSSLKK